MLVSLRRLLLPGFLFGLLFVGAAPAARADVRDSAQFFSKETVQKADDIIREIRKETTKDVVVETFAEAPASKMDALKGEKSKQALRDWAAERARELKVNGVFVLICKKPSKLEVLAGAKTREKAFTDANVKELASILLKDFKEKKFDEGLTRGLQYTLETMRTNLKGAKGASVVVEPIKDEGKFFSEKAVREAESVIADIQKKYKKDVIIETFAKKKDDVTVSDWAKQRARERNVNGVYVLICKEPPAMQVDTGGETAKKVFTHDDARATYEVMKKYFHDKKYDEGLLEGVRFIEKKMGENTGGGAKTNNTEKTEKAPLTGPSSTSSGGKTAMPAAGPHFNWLGLVCPLLIVIGVVWLVIGLVRAFTGMGRGYGGAPGPGAVGPGYGAPGYGGGGGGFFSGLMGGLFGAVAGNWLYHNMFGGGGSFAHGASSSYGGSTGTDDTLRSDEGRDFAGTGGDYGGGDDQGGGAGGDYGSDNDDSGGAGGDFGGGDSGGGDSGGDFGGGGGDFGGGGGDFGGGGGDFGGGGGDF
jgi:uncharacterized protein